MFRRLPNGGNLKDVPVHSGVLEDQNEQTPTDELPGTPQQCVPLPKVTDSMETPAGRELSGISASSADDIVAGQHCHGTEHSPRHGDPVRSIPAGLAGLHVCMKPGIVKCALITQPAAASFLHLWHHCLMEQEWANYNTDNFQGSFTMNYLD
ncbi:uncharacterized protein LOC144112431 isoform X2 [Amblyomma americanum]